VHPRGWNTTRSDQRKLESYKVEHQWYEHYSDATRGQCPIPQLLGSYQEGESSYLLLEDLDSGAWGRQTCQHVF